MAVASLACLPFSFYEWTEKLLIFHFYNRTSYLFSFLLRCRLSFSAKKFFSAQASMASVSATSVRFPSSLKQSFGSNLVTGRTSIVKLASLGLAKGFPSLRSSSFRVSCTAKPETITRVCGVVRKQLSLPAESEVTPETKFSGLGADSLDLVEIVMSLEEEFGIIVEEEDSQNITTVQEAADLIEMLVQKKGNA